MYFVANLHTLTTLEDPEALRGNVPEIIKDYLAAGLDPERSIIYAQSSVPEISELSLLLSMIQPLGHLQRTPTFKEMVRKHPDNVNLGLVTYPVLMAADILGPQANLVPVGEDQVPNVELARDLAVRFNERFGQTFVVPKTYHELVKVPGLDGAKMGKSDGNAIDINSPIEDIRTAYRTRGVTDPARVRATDPGTPELCPSVYPVHLLATAGERTTRTIGKQCEAGTISCVACKNKLVDSLALILEPFQEKRRELADKDEYVREVLHEGGKRARAIFRETLDVVQDKMGVVVY
jgi:tryptophanyl-tRNA synthetase